MNGSLTNSLKERVAIIGSGIAGMACGWFLHRHCDIAIFEADDHVGGHSNTISVEEANREVPIDTGFMVYNEVTYPLLTRLFAAIDAPTKPTSMSFSVQHGASGTEWNGSSLDGLFAQRRNLLSVRHWRFLMEINRFNREAVEALETGEAETLTLADYVARRRYGVNFFERYLIPMSSAVWSTPPDRMRRFPAATLLRFWHNHGFLGLHTQHPWRTVAGGSREYVARLTMDFGERIHLNSPVTSIQRTPDKVTVATERRGSETFDRVIIATHADQAIRLLEKPTGDELEILSPFRYQPNPTDLHKDPRFMPRTKRCWASWNYRSNPSGDASVHYWMNALQGVSDKTDYFVTLNARQEIADSVSCRRLDYEHPLFDQAAMAAQRRLPFLNEQQHTTRTAFVGSYFRYGFHEDALLSAVTLCEQLLGGDPWARR